MRDGILSRLVLFYEGQGKHSSQFPLLPRPLQCLTFLLFLDDSFFFFSFFDNV